MSHHALTPATFALLVQPQERARRLCCLDIPGRKGLARAPRGLVFQPPWMPARGSPSAPAPTRSSSERRPGPELTVRVHAADPRREGLRGTSEPRGAPPPPPPGSPGAAGLGLTGCRATAVASGDAHAHFPLGCRQNAGCGWAVGARAAEHAEETARNSAGDPPIFMVRGWRATSGPHYLVGGGRTAGHPPQHLLAWVPSLPTPTGPKRVQEKKRH